MAEGTVEELEDYFSWVSDDDRILAVLLFGSVVRDEEHLKSDVDVCVVVPGASHFYYDCEGVSDEKVDASDVLMKVFRKVDTASEDIDVHIFEDLPLHVQMDIIEDHEVVYTSDKLGMYEYFYNYRKLWDDQKHRNAMNEDELKAGL